ncbi:alcohol dehydrogenase protein [Meredithblackwellia eburnea MCA 4105]
MTIPSTHSGYLVAAPGLGVNSLKLVKNQPTPVPGRGQVLVAIKAVSLNFRDWAVIQGIYPGVKNNLIPCSDASGEIVAIGSDVTAWSIGDRVMGQFTQSHIAGPYESAEYPSSALGAGADGVLVEYKVFGENGVVRVPDHLSWEEAATLPCAPLTAWNSLFGSDGGSQVLLPGQTVLIQGTGGVSSFGAQLAHYAGARVIVTSSSEKKLKILLDHIKSAPGGGGTAEIHTINYRTNPDWEKEALRITGGVGVDFVLEIGGPGTLEKSFACLRQGGVIANIGFLANATNQPNIAMLSLFKAASFRGILIGSKRQFEQMNTMLTVSGIKPRVAKVYKFEDVHKAYYDQNTEGVVGKVVIQVAV